jgi:transcriptional regulator with GAF, ATPase, and Fis domain
MNRENSGKIFFSDSMVFYLYLPPLRERKETIPISSDHLCSQINQLLNKHVNRVSKP